MTRISQLASPTETDPGRPHPTGPDLHRPGALRGEGPGRSPRPDVQGVRTPGVPGGPAPAGVLAQRAAAGGLGYDFFRAARGPWTCTSGGCGRSWGRRPTSSRPCGTSGTGCRCSFRPFRPLVRPGLSEVRRWARAHARYVPILSPSSSSGGGVAHDGEGGPKPASFSGASRAGSPDRDDGDAVGGRRRFAAAWFASSTVTALHGGTVGLEVVLGQPRRQPSGQSPARWPPASRRRAGRCRRDSPGRRRARRASRRRRGGGGSPSGRHRWPSTVTPVATAVPRPERSGLTAEGRSRPGRRRL